ncbi:hypothetical protein RIR_jg29391.t1 [Rhizophagus irregularis DAOM 181602=DAOM 197198]|nr:hypothetical protein RIR_jg29391.t1 [Rhizophagus irregularis DAOM 181602=DAOM 197198]
MSMAHITWINSNNFFVVYNPRIGAYTFQTILSKADLIICQKSGFGNLMEPYLWILMTGISQDDQTSYRRLKENIEVILFLKIKKDLSEMLRIYEVDNGYAYNQYRISA